MRRTPPLPIPVKKALFKLGEDIRAARIRRQITTTIMAKRVFTSRTTLGKVEKGDSSVSMGVYATVLFILGLSSRLEELVDICHDSLGLELSQEALPKRVRSRRQSQSKKV